MCAFVLCLYLHFTTLGAAIGMYVMQLHCIRFVWYLLVRCLVGKKISFLPPEDQFETPSTRITLWTTFGVQSTSPSILTIAISASGMHAIN